MIRGKSLETGEELEPPDKTPCLVHLDSCKGHHNGAAMARMVIKWLQAEVCKLGWAGDEGKVIEHLPVINQEVPQQPNGTCCAVYMLQGIEHFVATWPEVRKWHLPYRTIPHFSKMSFEHHDITVNQCAPILHTTNRLHTKKGTFTNRQSALRYGT